MGKRLVERRLTKIGTQLKSLRAELAIVDEQLHVLGDDAEDQAIRAMVAETAGSSFDARAARGNFENMARHRLRLATEIDRLETRQDELLDQLTAPA